MVRCKLDYLKYKSTQPVYTEAPPLSSSIGPMLSPFSLILYFVQVFHKPRQYFVSCRVFLRIQVALASSTSLAISLYSSLFFLVGGEQEMTA